MQACDGSRQTSEFNFFFHIGVFGIFLEQKVEITSPCPSDKTKKYTRYSDNSIKNTVLRPNRQYKASTAEMA